ncbi:hypothetical protein V2J09_012555 [Rumex salicifolius]
MDKKEKILMQRYELGRFLGQGNFAKVYFARDMKSNQNVAIKVIDKEKVLKVGLDLQIKREISAMKMLRHANVLQVYEVMASKSNIYMVLEYAKGGELFNKVAKGRLKEDIARWVFQQLISAVDFCHRRGVYHRDLKLENLLLDDLGNLKVSDFGLSTLVESSTHDELLKTICGTPAYVAPEVISRKGYDGAKADTWSCGVILYAMLAGYLPFQDSNIMEMYKKIRRAEYKCPNWFPTELRKLVAKILDPNPRRRISIAKIMENPWFKRGLGTTPVASEVETGQLSKPVMCTTLTEKKQELGKLSNLNAFDIISLSPGFDLSGLFVENEQREDVSFTSQQPAAAIMSKLEEVAVSFKLKVLKKDGGGFLRLTQPGEQGKESVVLDVEVFEFTPSFHLVEIKKIGGDSIEYQRMIKQDIKPAIKDIVWAWQGYQISNHIDNIHQPL